MIGLVGVAGFAGAGKTTASRYLSNLTGGRYFYLGQTVLDVVRARGLPETRESERVVRLELRRANAAALVVPYIDEIAECVGNGIPVFIDAIFVREEFDLFRSRVPNCPTRLLVIDASLATRETRLAGRSERAFSAEELRERESTEHRVLGTDAVIAAADYTIRNEGTFEEFYGRLAEFVRSCG